MFLLSKVKEVPSVPTCNKSLNGFCQCVFTACTSVHSDCCGIKRGSQFHLAFNSTFLPIRSGVDRRPLHISLYADSSPSPDVMRRPNLQTGSATTQSAWAQCPARLSARPTDWPFDSICSSAFYVSFMPFQRKLWTTWSERTELRKWIRHIHFIYHLKILLNIFSFCHLP